MPIEKLKPSFHFEAERIEQLKQIAPEAFADGKINWETLQEALGEYLEDETYNAEHFGLFWPGKREARKTASTKSLCSINPNINDSIDFDNTSNVFIEGENLEVLKLIQKSYNGRAKLIYIDPPYNTGHDFVYNDNFQISTFEYLKDVNLIDEKGSPLVANVKSDGRFHSKWLSMMYPRLRLARNLLSDEGIIFIHIDDNEVANLRLLMNEVFGEENFIAQICHKSRASVSNDKIISSNHNHILLYSKDYVSIFEKRKMFGLDPQIDGFKLEDKNGKYKLVPVDGPGGATKGNPYYEFMGVKQYFRFSKERMQKMYEDGKIIKVGNGLQQKYYLSEAEKTRKTDTTWWDEKYYNSTATSKLIKLMGGDYFSNPKPIELLKRILSLWCRDENDLVIDFFAGSGSTAQAVLEYQVETNIKINFLTVQLDEKYDENEPAYKDGYRFISDFTRARINKVIKQLPKNKLLDFGYKYFSLNISNFKLWKNYIGSDIKELETLFENNSTPLVEDWKPENLLTEVMLIEGFPLDSKLKIVENYKYNKVTEVSSDFCEHKLLVCLDEKIEDKTIKALQLDDEDIFICLDTAISDQDKVTLQDKGLIKTI